MEDYSHLSKPTRDAIAAFKAHHHKRFYDKRTLEADETVLDIPEEEMAEYVRITTAIQDGEE